MGVWGTGLYVPRTSRGLDVRAVLQGESQSRLQLDDYCVEGSCSCFDYCLPCVTKNDVVERRVTLAETGETDFKNHGEQTVDFRSIRSIVSLFGFKLTRIYRKIQGRIESRWRSLHS